MEQKALSLKDLDSLLAHHHLLQFSSLHEASLPFKKFRGEEENKEEELKIPDNQGNEQPLSD